MASTDPPPPPGGDDEREGLARELEKQKRAAAELARTVERRNRGIEIIRRVAAEVNATLDLDQVLRTILRLMDELFGFRYSMVLLVDPPATPGGASDGLTLVASQGYPVSGVGVKVRFGEGIIGTVAKHRRVVRLAGIRTRRSYVASVRPAVAPAAGPNAPAVVLPGLPDVDSTIAVPMLVQETMVGVFAVESAAQLAFDEEDQKLVTTVANQAALAIQNARLFREVTGKNEALTQLNAASSRFVPYEFVRFLRHGSLSDVRRGDHLAREMSVFFSDIRSYTSITEQMTPDQNFQFVNEYFAAMAPVIHQHGGFIDKFIGDAIMAIFDNDAAPVVAAVESLRALARYNAVRVGRGDQPIDVGIGLHTGPLILGTVGSEDRLNCTVNGDSVNLASRVEGMTKMYGAHILVTESTWALAKDAGVEARAVGRVRVKGKREPVTVYEVLDGLEDAERARKLETRERFNEGWVAFRRGQMERALACFEAVLARDPEDAAAALYIGECRRCLAEGVPEGWEGVLTLTSK